MPSVEKRGSKWSVRFVVKDEFGKIIGQKRKSGFATKAEAMAAAADLEKASEKGIDIHGDSSTCGQIMEEWFDHKTKAGDIEETTLVKYSSYIDRLESTPIYNTPIRKIGRNALSDLIRSIRDDSGVSVRSAVCYTEPLRFALKWAVETGRIMSNPLQSQRLPKVPKRPQVILTDRDISDLIDECKRTVPNFLIPIYLALYGGLCREESAGLLWTNVKENSVTIVTAVTSTVLGKKVTKSPKTANRERTVTLPKFVMEELRQREHTSPFVCVSRTGKPYGLSTYAHTVKRLADRINARRFAAHEAPMPVPSYHDLRHTHAAMCIDLGFQPKVIQERLGHASIKTTMDLYGYLMPGIQSQIADALDKLQA